MAKGVKTGGRTKGTKNRATVDVEAKLAKLGLDPIEGMARIALGVDCDGNPISVSIDLKAKMLSELAQYTAPKRKAIEHSGSVGLHEEALTRLKEKLREHDSRG